MNKIISIVTLILIFFAGYAIGFFKNTKKIMQVYPTLFPSNFPSNAVTPAEILSAKEKAKFVVTKFEELQKARNSDVLNMFTPPLSKNEAETYSFLMGYDLPSYDVEKPTPRLFVTAGFAYKVNEYKLNSILETERGYHIEVEEIRSSYNNVTGRLV